MKEPSFVVITDDTNTVIDIYDVNDSCNPYEPNDVCGGCGYCLLLQAKHYGYKTRLPTKEEMDELNNK